MRKTTLFVTTGVVAAALFGGAAAFAATGTAPAPTATATAAATPAGTTSGSNGAADLDAAIAAALAEVGPGTVVEADIDDDASHAYEIDIRLDAGGFAEVKLDSSFAVVSVEFDDGGGDDEVTDPSTRDAASAAALAATGGGTVVSVEASDDADHAWEVEVDLGNGEDADVELDADFQVVEVD